VRRNLTVDGKLPYGGEVTGPNQVISMVLKASGAWLTGKGVGLFCGEPHVQAPDRPMYIKRF